MKTESEVTAQGDCCDAKLLKVAGDKITSATAKGDEQTFTVAKDTKVTCDGKVTKASDLRTGATIRMTLCKEDKSKVTAIDCGKHIPELAKA